MKIEKLVFLLLLVLLFAFGCTEAADMSYKIYTVGETGPAGGIVFYDKGEFSDGWRFLEAPLVDQVDWAGEVYLYKTNGVVIPEATYAYNSKLGDGKQATAAIVAELGSQMEAAYACYELSLGGYSDWYLPNMAEIYELYLQKDLFNSFEYRVYWTSSLPSNTDTEITFYHMGNGTLVRGLIASAPVRAIRRF